MKHLPGHLRFIKGISCVNFIRLFIFLDPNTISFLLSQWVLSLYNRKLYYLIKNVSSSTSHKKSTSLRLSLWEFKKILFNTFIYKSILIKIYMNANIRNTQIFHFINIYFQRSLKVTKGHLFLF